MENQTQMISQLNGYSQKQSDLDLQDDTFLQVQRTLIYKLCLEHNIFLFKSEQIPETQTSQNCVAATSPDQETVRKLKGETNKNNVNFNNDTHKINIEMNEDQILNENLPRTIKVEQIMSIVGNKELEIVKKDQQKKDNLLFRILKIFQKHLIDKDYSQIIVFFAILFSLFLFLCVLGPITFPALLFYLPKDKDSSCLFILCLMILPIILMTFSGFFYSFIIGGSKYGEFDSNSQMFLINLQCFTQLIYIFLVLTSYIQAVIFFQIKLKDEGIKICKSLGLDMQRMQIEFIDRKDTTVFFEQKDTLKILKHFRRTKFSCFTLLDQMEKKQSPFSKNWNSAIELMNSLPLANLDFQNKKYNKWKKIFQFILVAAYVYIIIQFKSGFPTSNYEKWKLATMVVNCFSYSVMLVVFQVLPKVVETELDIFKGLTVLLEVSNVNPQVDTLNKQSSTLNLYCLYTIQSWAFLHRLAIQLTHSFFKYLNVLQCIDIMIIISLIFLLALDFYGNLWQTRFIYKDQEVFISILLNIGIRVLFTLFPIFTSFSECSEILEYNRIQIRTMMRNLQRIKLEYYTLRVYLKNFTDFHLKVLKINEITKENLANIENRINNQDFKIDNQDSQCEYMPSEEILTDLIAVYEIKRNSILYAHEHSNSYEIIQQEINYLNQLIKAYKYIHTDMKEVKELYTLKFLGLIEVSYGEAQALLFIIIPAIGSLIIQRLFALSD